MRRSRNTAAIIPVLQDLTGRPIVSAIEYVTSDDLRLCIHWKAMGEAELSDGITSEIEKQNVELKSLNLVTEGEVPEDAEAILIWFLPPVIFRGGSKSDHFLSGQTVEKL